MSRTWYALLALSLLTGIPALAETTCPPPPAQPTQEEIQAAMAHSRDRGFLWRISKDGHDSWLYGTIHVGRFDWMFPGPQVTKALQGSEVLALELDMLDPDIRQRMMKGIAALASPANPKLPPVLVSRLNRQAEAGCLPYAAIADYPVEWQLATIILVRARLDGLEATYATDGVLAGIGHGAQKQVVSLETPEMQLSMLKLDTPQETRDYLEEALQEMESGKDRKQLRHIADVWDRSDDAELARYEEWCECMDTPAQQHYMRKLLDGRNPALAEQIDALHQQGKSVFAAVGSLHMFGKSGLPDLLKQRGYRVERIVFTQQTN